MLGIRQSQWIGGTDDDPRKNLTWSGKNVTNSTMIDVGGVFPANCMKRKA